MTSCSGGVAKKGVSSENKQPLDTSTEESSRNETQASESGLAAASSVLGELERKDRGLLQLKLAPKKAKKTKKRKQPALDF